MRHIIFSLITVLFVVSIQAQKIDISSSQASSFAELALKCIHQPYPYKPGHVLGSDADAVPPRDQHPAFYGCFDWHSAVHGHWMLVKLLKEFPDISEADEIRQKIDENLKAEHIQTEIEFLYDKNNKTFERTYGWAWLLKLTEELLTWDDQQGKHWAQNIKPLADSLVNKYIEFLPKLNYPIRVGEHTNTAFGLTFAWDYAHTTKNFQLGELIALKAGEFYLEDKDCPISWEPGGFDFLSPCLIEADMMSRVLNPNDFSRWLNEFLPGLIEGDIEMEPAVVTDRTDGKLVHLDGLNLSRAWCLFHIAEKLPGANEKIVNLAYAHLNSALPQITSGSYEGEHWLASFGVYALLAQ